MVGRPTVKQPKVTLAESLRMARLNHRDLLQMLRDKDERADSCRESRDHWLGQARDRYIEMRRG